MPVGLSDGARIAVVGAGPAGAAFASSLLTAVRAFGRKAELVLFDGSLGGGAQPIDGRREAPVLLDLKTRCRLASLGAVISADATPHTVRGLLVQFGKESSFLAPPNGGLWVLDSPQAPGRELLKRALVESATLRGAQVQRARVEAVEQSDFDEFAVRAGGGTSTFHCVIGAFGRCSALETAWLDGAYQPPPRRPGLQARLSWPDGDALMRLVLLPTEQLAALLLLPFGNRAYALAISRASALPPSALAEALALLVRDGVLPRGVRIGESGIEPLWLGAGVARRTCGPGRITIGAAAHGHLLDPGVFPALCSATRAAQLLFALGESAPLNRPSAFLQRELLDHARRQPQFLKAACRAGPLAPARLSGVLSEARPVSDGLSILGIPALALSGTLRALRWTSWARAIGSIFGAREAPPPVAPPSPSDAIHLLDDDADTRALFTAFLASRGYEVRAFDSEIALLEAAARQAPRVILIDVVLRWVDGLKLCRLLREHPSTRSALIVAISNLSRKADGEAARRAGADAFLPKPVDLRLLGEMLEKASAPAKGQGERLSSRRARTSQ